MLSNYELEAILKRSDILTTSFKAVINEENNRIFTLTAPGSEAVKLWQKLRNLVEKTGFWPVILGDAREVERLLSNVVDSLSLQTNLETGASLDAPGWLEKGLEEVVEDGADLPRGDWPLNFIGNDYYSIPWDVLTGKFLPQVFLALVSTKISWQVPAYFGWGGWNACPAVEEHVGVLKYWDEIYGLELVGMSSDILELKVSRPPQDREVALALAIQQYAYCSDIVDQGVETIDNLAATLLKSTVWYFWWD